MNKFDLVVFDLDGTLAPSKSFLDQEMSNLIMRLLEKKKVVVISGGSYNQFKLQFLKRLPENSNSFSNLILMPTSGTRMDIWDGEKWVEKYAELLTAEEKEKIMKALTEALEESNYEKPDKTFGPLIEDRGSQITFSALGQEAPLELKVIWDKDHKKRDKIAIPLRNKIPEFAVAVNAYTSIDITHKGVDKGYAINKLRDVLNIPIEKMLFIGDGLFEGGNDYATVATGVETQAVKGPEETKKVIRELLE